jgi:hypothetical protein
VTFLRLSAVAVMFAAALSCFSQDGTAQSFNTVSITIEPDWTGGYMGLGGGLVKSIVKPTENERADDDDKPASRHRLRRARATHASRAATPAINNVTPIAIVARTLDHTGYNISGVGWQAEAR